MPTKQAKRILSIKIKRMDDPDPDTSYLGEYSDTAKGEFSIDRKHAVDCPAQPMNRDDATIDKLERAIAYLNVARLLSAGNPESITWEAIDDAQNLLIEAQDRVTECTCDESGDWSRNELLYFNPGSVEPFNPNASWIPADTADKQAYWCEAMRSNALQNYQRMEALQRSDWFYIGIQAEAEIVVNGVIQHVTSGGLWRIESDSNKSYLAEIEQEELAQLREQLYTLEFSKRAISAAVKSAGV